MTIVQVSFTVNGERAMRLYCRERYGIKGEVFKMGHVEVFIEMTQ